MSWPLPAQSLVVLCHGEAYGRASEAASGLTQRCTRPFATLVAGEHQSHEPAWRGGVVTWASA
jgi:hypothetical protein